MHNGWSQVRIDFGFSRWRKLPAARRSLVACAVSYARIFEATNTREWAGQGGRVVEGIESALTFVIRPR